MRIPIYLVIISLFFSKDLSAQTQNEVPPKGDLDSLKMAIVNLEADLAAVELRMNTSAKTLRAGILVATLGYTVTIIGGQLLGVNPEVGEALLYTGGGIGIAGTIVLFKGFNTLGKKPKNRKLVSER